MPRVSKKASVAETAEPVSAVTVKKERRFSPTLFVMGVLLLLSLGVGGYFFYQYKHTSEVMQREEIEKLVSVIGSSMELPQGEFPTLATVTNKEKLDDQAFFLRAENGDKILIYSGAGRAILYRPATKKIIDVTSVNIVKDDRESQSAEELFKPEEKPVESETASSVEQAVDQAVAEVLAPPTLTLYNGSTKVGITGPVETQIASDFSEVIIKNKEKAAKTDYTETLVIDLSEAHSDLAARMASELGGKVSSLPVGETNPGTDMLIIVAYP